MRSRLLNVLSEKRINFIRPETR